jgi:hypothetical protein
MAVARHVKLRPDALAERRLTRWLGQLEGVWNWAVGACEREAAWYRVRAPQIARRTAEQDWLTGALQAFAEGAPLPPLIDPATRMPTLGAYLQVQLFAALNGHSARCEIPVAVLRQTVQAAIRAWLQTRERRRAWWAAGGPASGRACPRVRRRGARHPLTWLGADSVTMNLEAGTLQFPGLVLSKAEAKRRVRKYTGLRLFRHSAWPQGRVAGTVRLCRRARGWYAVLTFPDAQSSLPPLDGDAAPVLGADLGFRSVVTLSDGMAFGRATVEDRLWRQRPKVARRESPHPNHQATRTGRRQRAEDRRRRRSGRGARLEQRLATAKQWRNRLVVRAVQQRTAHLVLLEDRLPALQRVFGKSILRNALSDLTQRLVTTQRQGPPTGAAAAGTGDRRWMVTLVPGAHSTTTCPACQARTGPSGLGLGGI